MAVSTDMLRYISRRFLQAIPLLIGIILVNFVIVHLAPGDPIQVLMGDAAVSPEYEAELRHLFGLDKPIYVQLLLYFKALVRGDLGYSFFYREPVLDIISARMLATLYLMVNALIFASIVGVISGTISAAKPYSLRDNFITVVSIISYSLPVFWLGQMMLIYLSLKLNLFPASGMISQREGYIGFRYALDVGYHLVLPVLCLSTRHIALTARLTRAAMIETMSADYIVTARAKGLSEKRVLIGHGLRNALLPVVTIVGLSFRYLLAGSVLVETVFAWPGLGRLMYNSISVRDYPTLMGILLIISASVIIVNLLTDILYGFLDPRVRY